LEHAEQFRLHGERHLADLVEEDRAAARRFEEAAVILGRAGERAAAVAEELALEQGLGDRGAVDGEERLVGARRGAVDAARHELLAGAGLALDQHRDRRRRGALHQLEHLEHRAARADDLVEPVAVRHVAAQGADLGAQEVLARLDAREEARVLDRHRDAAGQRLEEGEIVVRERLVVPPIQHLDDADYALVGGERSAQQRAGGEAGGVIDAGEEALVGLDVVDAGRGAVAQHPAGDAAVGGEAQLEQAGEDRRIILGDEREIELVGVGVEQQHRRAHGVEHLAALADHEWEQLVELDARGERAREVVEHPETCGAFVGRTAAVESH
jgi:hypothetical protein